MRCKPSLKKTNRIVLMPDAVGIFLRGIKHHVPKTFSLKIVTGKQRSVTRQASRVLPDFVVRCLRAKCAERRFFSYSLLNAFMMPRVFLLSARGFLALLAFSLAAFLNFSLCAYFLSANIFLNLVGRDEFQS